MLSGKRIQAGVDVRANQNQLSISLETQAKLEIQDLISANVNPISFSAVIRPITGSCSGL